MHSANFDRPPKARCGKQTCRKPKRASHLMGYLCVSSFRAGVCDGRPRKRPKAWVHLSRGVDGSLSSFSPVPQASLNPEFDLAVFSGDRRRPPFIFSSYPAAPYHVTPRSDSFPCRLVSTAPVRRRCGYREREGTADRRGSEMDAELLELQRQLEAAQSARSSVRLSERNVVELVQKLQERGIIDFDLLHTASGKEYITSVSPFPFSPGSVPLTCGFSLHFIHDYTNATAVACLSRLVRNPLLWREKLSTMVLGSFV
jgi:hypothetical protein